MSVATLKVWLQNHPNPKYRRLFHWLKRLRAQEIPTPRLFNLLMRHSYQLVQTTLTTLLRLFIHTPAFKGRLNQCGKRLYLYGGVPYVAGPLTISIGDDCRISGQTTFTGRSQSSSPRLTIGHNVDIGWQNTLAIGNQIIIEDNVRLAGGVFLFGYSGHSLDAAARAQARPILIKMSAIYISNKTLGSEPTLLCAQM
ncbi:acetyltransferase SypM [Vibrio ponticus]|nr:acetyltransferase SypM [Vibrio ponticus]